HETFGDGQDLYATLFVGNKAFFVTYRRIDPLHAFVIADDGDATEISEFEISGWNDFFKPVFGETRMVGVGINDEGARDVSVSLYDISELDNPEPLIARAGVGSDWSWSEANWDHRAFTVLENAVEVQSGENVETGLILLPFTGYNQDDRQYEASVQIFTFSADSLTARGIMEHGTQVRRSFEADDDVTANLSEAELSLFDTSDVDAPVELGRVDLAPNYTDFLVFGEYGVRIKDSRDYYSWYNDGTERTVELEVVRLTDDPDLTGALASIEAPASAQFHQAGDLLVAVQYEYVGGDYPDYDYDTTVTVFDFSDPENPTEAGSFVTDQLVPSYGGYYYYGSSMADDCFDCGGGYWYGGSGSDIFPIDDALVFLQRHQERELEGTNHVCNTYPTNRYGCYQLDERGEEVTDCSWYSGGIYCSSLDGAPETCSGEIQLCTQGEGSYSCEPVDVSTVETQSYCYDYEQYRYWQSFDVAVVDLRDAQAPSLATVYDLPQSAEGTSLITEGSSIWVSHKEPVEVAGDSRPYVRHFIQRLDASNLDNIVADQPINVPGQLVAVNGDVIYTQDTIWGDQVIDVALAESVLYRGRAYLRAFHQFEDQQVDTVLLDGDGHILVSHRMAWQLWYEIPSDVREENFQVLTILDADSQDLAVLSDTAVDSWGSLSSAQAGRALFNVGGGLLVMNTEDGSDPFPQAFFATRGWYSELTVDGREAYFAAGRYGVYSFDLDEYNLLQD
ncbi:MAG: beta-propeller domain-containing protein, partial [Myxococcales bacterium]|nr:beta-propeller domain-containing protein [Myxococcales bacterium]